MALQLDFLHCLTKMHFMNTTLRKVAVCKHQVKRA